MQRKKNASQNTEGFASSIALSIFLAVVLSKALWVWRLEGEGIQRLPKTTC